jgi:hypothetical protein
MVQEEQQGLQITRLCCPLEASRALLLCHCWQNLQFAAAAAAA